MPIGALGQPPAPAYNAAMAPAIRTQTVTKSIPQVPMMVYGVAATAGPPWRHGRAMIGPV